MKPHRPTSRQRQASAAHRGQLHPRTSDAGFALIEVVVAAALVIMTAVSVTHLFITSNRLASANRVLTAARAVVQRNLDSALAVRWETTVTPSILAITSAGGSVFDDDGANLNGEGTNKVALLIEKKTDGTTYTVIPATLNRIVTPVANAQGADIRRVRFRLTYTFQNRNQVVEMSTMRAIDD